MLASIFQKFIFQALIIFSLLIIFFLLYVKYFEKRCIFYPTSEIIATPKSKGLDYQEIYLLTEDGVRLNAWFIEVENPLATLLFCHGNAGNISHRVEMIKMFHDVGLNVFIFDYRGYGKSQGRPSEKGLYQDALSSYRYLLQEKKILPQRIIIYGKSIGGNVAINLAFQAKNGLLISDSAFTSALDMGKNLFPFLPRFFLKSILGVKFDAFSKIKEITIPKLIIHSKDDEIVPFKYGKKLFIYASPPKEFYILNGSHNEAVFLHSREYASTVRRFIEKYLEGQK
ncbi:MAG: alpha/beta hydrolase [Candidatus Omnitrophica bacterium]|nr:alpha/beta hydrolase [Candidatus Omnitrophota bacterium]